MSPETSSPVRQAALTLHAMAPHDAAWLLGQLPPVEAAELQSLLEELRGLGIPSDPGLLDELSKGNKAPQVSAFAGKAGTADLSLEDLKRELDGARAELLLPILRPEPAALLAFLLSLNSWQWTDSLLAGLETHRRLSLRLQLGNLGLNAETGNAQADQLQLALLTRLLERYRRAEASLSPSEAGAHTGGFERWWQERRRVWSSIVAPMKVRK